MPILNIYSLRLDVRFNKILKLDNVFFVQGDEKTGYLDITLLEGRTPFNLTQADRIEIAFKKTDGNITKSKTNDISPRLIIINAELGKLQYQMGTQDISCVGQVISTLSLYDEEGGRLTACEFSFYIRRDLDIDNQAIDSTSENCLDQRIEDLKNGITGVSGGNMVKLVYDPDGIESNIFDMDNMVESETKKIFTNAERTKLEEITSGASTFVELTDTPANYTGANGKYVKVNTSGDALEFITLSGGGDMATGTYDPTSIAGDVFDMDNMVESSTSKVFTDIERDKLTEVSNYKTRHKTGLLIPLYVYPTDPYVNADYNNLINLKRQHAKVPVIAIINPISGVGESIDSNYTIVCNRLVGSGVDLVGYIASTYGARSLQDMKDEMVTWLSYYPKIVGFFIDEVEWATSIHQNYIDLKEYATTLGIDLVIGNPGCPVPNDYVDAFDITVISESAFATINYPALKGDWAGGFIEAKNEKKCVLVHTMATYDVATLNAVKENADWVYFTSGGWTVLPSYLSNVFDDIESPTPVASGGALQIYYNEALSETMTNSTSLETKVTLTLPSNFEAGDYFIETSYQYHMGGSTSFDMIVEVYVDTVLTGAPHVQEPKELGLDQAYLAFTRTKKTFTAGTHIVELKYGTSSLGINAYIAHASITVTRISIL